MSNALESLATLRAELPPVSATDAASVEARAGLPGWLSTLRDECFGLAEAQGIPTRRLEGMLMSADLTARGDEPTGVWNYLGLVQTRGVAEAIVDEMANWKGQAHVPLMYALRLLRSRPAREVLRDTLKAWPHHPRAQDFKGVLKS